MKLHFKFEKKFRTDSKWLQDFLFCPYPKKYCLCLKIEKKISNIIWPLQEEKQGKEMTRQNLALAHSGIFSSGANAIKETQP